MKIRQKYLFYILAFSSAIIAAASSSLDAVATALYIPNALAFGLACFLVGIVITLFFAVVLSIHVGEKSLGSRFIDPSFKHIRLIKKEEFKYHTMAGLGNAVFTVSYFALLSILGDPSVVLPFSQIVILYLLAVESFTEKNIPTLIEIQSSVIVTFGAILGSISVTGMVNIESLLIVFCVLNPAWVVFSIYQRRLKVMRIGGEQNDAINIRFWNVVFACLFTVVLVLGFDFLWGTHYFWEGVTAVVEYFNWIALIMGVTFFSYVFYIRALGIGKASITQAVRASIIIFTIPFSLVLSYFGVIAPFPMDPVMLLIKVIGVVLMVLGIVSFALTLIKAYIFIRVKPGYRVEEIMQKLWDIRGVTRVAAVAGPYDFIVKINTRTLVKGYERIIRSVEEIDGIKEFKWQSVLKEWGNI